MSQRLGEFLKEARVKAGLSLEQLSTRTRVRVENLAALESEELESLPADPYVRGFVKIVCRELRLSPEEGLALYSKLRSNTILPDEITWSEENTISEPGALEKALQDPDRVMDYAKRARRWAIPLIAIVVLGVMILVVKGGKILAEEDDGAVAMRQQTKKTTVVPQSAPSETAESQKSSETPVLDAGRTPPAPKTNVSGEGPEGVVPKPPQRAPMIERSETKPPPQEAAGEESKTVMPEAGEPATESSAPQGDSLAGGVAGSEAVEPAVVDTTIESTPLAPGEPIMLEILAVRDAEVTLVLDGVGLPRKRSLISGEKKAWKADSLFVLSVSDGGAVLLKLGDAYIGSPGMDGETVTNLTIRR